MRLREACVSLRAARQGHGIVTGGEDDGQADRRGPRARDHLGSHGRDGRMGRRAGARHAGVLPARHAEHARRLRSPDGARRPAQPELPRRDARRHERRVPPAGGQPGREPDPADRRSRPVVPGLEPGQRLPPGLVGQAGDRDPGRLHQPLRGAAARRRVRPAARRARSLHGQAPARPLPCGRDHDRLDPGLGEDVPLAGPRPGRARLHRADLRRPGPGHERDVPASGPAGRLPVLRPVGGAGRGRAEQLPRRALPAVRQLRLRHPRRADLPARRRPSVPIRTRPPARLGSTPSTPCGGGSTAARTSGR